MLLLACRTIAHGANLWSGSSQSEAEQHSTSMLWSGSSQSCILNTAKQQQESLEQEDDEVKQNNDEPIEE